MPAPRTTNPGAQQRRENCRRRRILAAVELARANGWTCEPAPVDPDQPRYLGPADEPQDPGAIVAVHYGDYRQMELWVASSGDIGVWVPIRAPGLPIRGVWTDVLDRGPVVLLTPAPEDVYRAGHAAGVRELFAKIQEIGEDL